MQYRYPLPPDLAGQATQFEEFANGGAQCHAQSTDGSVHGGLLVSNSTAIIAMRGGRALPFDVAAISRLFQSEEDMLPTHRRDWEFFDEWKA
jgi:hypothetical protein